MNHFTDDKDIFNSLFIWSHVLILNISFLSQTNKGICQNQSILNSVHKNHRTCQTFLMSRPKCLMRDFTNLSRTYKAHRTNVWLTMTVFQLHCLKWQLWCVCCVSIWIQMTVMFWVHCSYLFLFQLCSHASVWALWQVTGPPEELLGVAIMGRLLSPPIISMHTPCQPLWMEWTQLRTPWCSPLWWAVYLTQCLVCQTR